MRIGLQLLSWATMGLLLFGGWGCADDGPRSTVPPAGSGLRSSDGLRPGGGSVTTPPAGRPGASVGSGAGGAGSPGPGTGVGDGVGAGATTGTGAGGAAVPSGLDMRGGGSVSAPTSSLAQGGGGTGATNPRTLPPPWIGGPRAKVVIEEFSDFECPFCQAGARSIKRVLAHYGARVKVVFRHLPLKFHRQAKLAAQAAVCAQAQGKFWPMQTLLFENNRALTRADLLKYARRLGLDVPRFTRELDSGACLARVEADVVEARKRVIEGTPAFFINGTKHEGALPFATFRKLIDAALSE